MTIAKAYTINGTRLAVKPECAGYNVYAEGTLLGYVYKCGTQWHTYTPEQAAGPYFNLKQAVKALAAKLVKAPGSVPADLFQPVDHLVNWGTGLAVTCVEPRSNGKVRTTLADFQASAARRLKEDQDAQG